jgi:hypothetical protein
LLAALAHFQEHTAPCFRGSREIWGLIFILHRRLVKYTSEHTGEPFGAFFPIANGPPSAFAILLCEGFLMEYKGVEYSVVQLTDASGWRWKFTFEGRTKTGVMSASRAAAIKIVESEIDRALKDRKK